MAKNRRAQAKHRPPPFTRDEVKPDDVTEGVHKIVVGVDFGTTYTGVSWVSTAGTHGKTLDDVHCIRDWPGSTGYGSKTPSRIAYVSENSNTIVANAWGFEVSEKMKSYSWMKLLLDPSVSTKYDDPSLAKSEGLGVLAKPAHKSSVEICADFLSRIACYAYSILEKRLGNDMLRITPIDFWLTVPAVWSDKAKDDTLRAAKMAFRQSSLILHPDSQIFLVREPEAAAVAIMAHLTKGGSQQQLQAGDSIMICDCGGGTVDIVSHKIIATTPKLLFDELVVGTGGKCGSTYIDREFIKRMEELFGTAYTSLKWEKRGPASAFMQKFEAHKRSFQSSISRDKYELELVMRDVGDSEYYDEEESSVIFKHLDMKKLFDTVIDKIIALLQSQLDAIDQTDSVRVKTVLLAGGFGDSNYLNERLHTWCDGMGIRLICPVDPQSAIVRGAALAGLLGIQPSSRRSRMHYGINVLTPFDPARHEARDLITSSWDGLRYADNQMSWKLSKGAIVDRSTKLEFTLSSRVTENELGIAEHSAEVFYSELDDAPRTSYASGCKKLGTIRLNFRDIDLNGCPLRSINGGYVRRVTANYVVSFGNRGGHLFFSAFVNGQEVGNTTMTFDGYVDGDNSQQNVDSDTVPNLPPCAPQ